MDYTWIIDAGHGGINSNGIYTTAPNKMHKFDDNFTVYEGVVNRQIAGKLHHQLEKLGIDFSLVYDDVLDTPLPQRVALANKLHNKNKLYNGGRRCIYLSLHSNASPNHDAKGIEVYTSPGKTDSDVIAEILCQRYKKHFPDHKFRAGLGDGDLDKEAKFYVLVNTLCPAVLVEDFFFDYRPDADLITSHAGQMAIVDCLLDWILEIEDSKPI